MTENLVRAGHSNHREETFLTLQRHRGTDAENESSKAHNLHHEELYLIGKSRVERLRDSFTKQKTCELFELDDNAAQAIRGN